MLGFHRRNWSLALVLALLVSLSACGSEDATGPAGPSGNGKKILVLEDGGTEVQVITVLRTAGFEVRSGGLFHEFTGAGLDWADAVVLLTGVDYNHDMDDRGERALVSFVEAGGGLLTTEWLCYSVDRSGYHQIINSIIPVTYDGSYANGVETWTISVDHPVTEGLADSFATATGAQFSRVRARTGATTLIQGSRSRAAVATWTKGGRVVSWSHAGDYGGPITWSAQTERVLTNAVGFISGL